MTSPLLESSISILLSTFLALNISETGNIAPLAHHERKNGLKEWWTRDEQRAETSGRGRDGELPTSGRREHVEEGMALEEECAETTIWRGFHCFPPWSTSRSRWEGWDVLVVIWANSVCYLVRYCKGWYQLVPCLNILPLVSGKYMVEPLPLSQKFRS